MPSIRPCSRGRPSPRPHAIGGLRDGPTPGDTLSRSTTAMAAGRRGMTPTQPDRRVTERRVAERRVAIDPDAQARVARRLREIDPDAQTRVARRLREFVALVRAWRDRRAGR